MVPLLTVFTKDLTGCFSHCCVKRWRSSNHCLHVHYSWWWEVQTSCLSQVSNILGSFTFQGQTWVLCVLACWFFSGEGGRSSSASCEHFQCLLMENFVFWQCSPMIGSASSLECNQSGCGVVHLGYATSIFWMLCDDQMCSPTQGPQRWQTPEVGVLSHLCHHCRRSTNALPVSTSILAHFCTSVTLYIKNVLLRCLINDIL